MHISHLLKILYNFSFTVQSKLSRMIVTLISMSVRQSRIESSVTPHHSGKSRESSITVYIEALEFTPLKSTAYSNLSLLCLCLII